MSAETLIVLEQVSTAMMISYVILIAVEKKMAWPLGILGSAIGSFVLYKSQYQAEAFLYLYYVIAGFYGWYIWETRSKESFKITEWSVKKHLVVLGFGVVLTYALTQFLSAFFPNNPKPLIDSFTTMFAFIATYMQVKKVYSNWWYWIIINAVTIYLYYSRGLNYYGALAIVNTILAIVGAFSWYKRRTLT